MERPIPKTKEEQEKLDIIDQICLDDNGKHCMPRVLLERTEDLPPCNLSRDGCHAEGWCPYRQLLYERHSARYLAQAKLIEVEEWLLGVKNKRPESYKHALEMFGDMEYGSATVFDYVWAMGVRDMGTLERMCVYSVIDNPPMVEQAIESKGI